MSEFIGGLISGSGLATLFWLGWIWRSHDSDRSFIRQYDVLCQDLLDQNARLIEERGRLILKVRQQEGKP